MRIPHWIGVPGRDRWPLRPSARVRAGLACGAGGHGGAPLTATGVSGTRKDQITGSASGGTPNTADTKANAIRTIEAQTPKTMSEEFSPSRLAMGGYKTVGENKVMSISKSIPRMTLCRCSRFQGSNAPALIDGERVAAWLSRRSTSVIPPLLRRHSQTSDNVRRQRHVQCLHPASVVRLVRCAQ